MMHDDTTQTLLQALQRRLAEVTARQQTLQTLLEETTTLSEEQQHLQQMLVWYERHTGPDEARPARVQAEANQPPPDTAGLHTALDEVETSSAAADLVEDLTAPAEAELPVVDPVTAALLAILDPDVPQSARQVQAQLNTRLGTRLSYNVVDGRLRRGVKHGFSQHTQEGWLRGPGLR